MNIVCTGGATMGSLPPPILCGAYRSVATATARGQAAIAIKMLTSRKFGMPPLSLSLFLFHQSTNRRPDDGLSDGRMDGRTAGCPDGRAGMPSWHEALVFSSGEDRRLWFLRFHRRNNNTSLVLVVSQYNLTYWMQVVQVVEC